MVVSRSAIRQIVTQAKSLFDRIEEVNSEIDTELLTESQVGDYLARWSQAVSSGDWSKFQRRLKWADLDIDAVRLFLTTPVDKDEMLPNWAKTLNEIIQTLADTDVFVESSLPYGMRNLPLVNNGNPVPFEDLWLPMVQIARRKLLECLASTSSPTDTFPLDLLTDQAYIMLEHSLLDKLLHLSMKTLYFEFSAFRPQGYNLLNLLVEEKPSLGKTVYYDDFIKQLLSDGLLTFFKKYPVLGKLIALSLDSWVQTTAEFLQRLSADFQKIQDHFLPFEHMKKVGEKDGLGKITKIKTALSDPHHHGRSVIALAFESGLKLIYKPKGLGIEVAFTQFLDWCNQHDAPLYFKVLKVVDCQNYGWVEYIEQRPCGNEAMAERFYQRAGVLLAMLYVLGGTDCHHENLVACGEHLLLVDMETLLHHDVNPMINLPEAVANETSVNQRFWDSVLRTGLLPRWDFGKDNRVAYDISGLGSIDPQDVPWRVPSWKSINRDDMYLTYETIPMPLQANVATLMEEVLSPNDYLDEIVEGFQQMYRFFIKYRRAFLAKDSPLEALSRNRVRFVFRATRIYSAILQQSLKPECLRSGVDQSIALEFLSRAFLASREKPLAWPILWAEQKAMERLDIPYFGAYADSDSLTTGVDVPIEHYFKEPSFDRLLKRLRDLSEKDLRRQVNIIQDAFHARIARPPSSEKRTKTVISRSRSVGFFDSKFLTASQLIQEAEAIAQELQDRVLEEADGGVNWIGLNFVPNAERFQLQPITENLYNGQCGIAFFLAALHFVTGKARFRDLALRSLQPVRQILQLSDEDIKQRFARSIKIGGASGLGSIVYSLARISHFLQRSAILEDAQRAADLITEELIAADRQYDIIAGAAGAILGLLALYDESGESAVLNQAASCAHQLLTHQISYDGAPKTWQTLEEKPLTGFSHGAAGIVYALLRLYAITQNDAYLEAAHEGIAYEQSVFSPEFANWPDFQSLAKRGDQPGFRVSWCSGAPGIALARLGGLSIYQTEAINRDIEIALQTTQNSGFASVDHVCCGNFGLVEVLLVAAQIISSHRLESVAQKKAAQIVSRAKNRGSYRLFINLPDSVYNPGFFQGTTGIGYQLLRLTEPEALPSVLLWA